MTSQGIYDSVKQFLQSSSNQGLIASGDFSELFARAHQYFKYAGEFRQLSELLIESGINVLSFLTKIPADFLYGCTESYVIKFPTTVQEIGDSAFRNAQLLTFSELPDKIRRIEDSAFFNCKGLISIALPGDMEYLGSAAFALCSGLTDVTIGEGIESLLDYAFRSCRNLINVYLPSTIRELEDEVFSGCPKLTIHYAGTKKDWANIKKGVAVVDDRASIKCSDGVWGVHN